MTQIPHNERFNSREDTEFEQQAFNEGYLSRMDNTKSCPYQERSWKQRSWSAGWADADMGLMVDGNS